MTDRRTFLAGSAATLGLATLAGCSSDGKDSGTGAESDTVPGPASAKPAVARREDRPNLVVILADDLGYGEVGAYGQKIINTPRIDRLATEGLRFTSAYSPAPVCAPSRCSLLTGLHSGHATVRQNPFHAPQGSLTANDTTFAEVLRARGYRTAVIGKWGFGPEQVGQPSHPNSRGFEEFYGYISHRHAHSYYPSYLWHNGEEVPLDGKTYAPDLITARALDFIAGHADEPFLLYLAPTVPHAPSDVPEFGEYAHEPWPDADKGHAAQVAYFDTLVGQVADKLTALGIAHDTVVLVASDNGPHEEGGVDPDRFDANGPLRGYKRNLYEGGIRTPLIAWGPGRIAAGTTDRPTPLTDLLPTLADLAGAPAPTDIDGLSAAPLLSGDAKAAAARHDALYFYRNDPASTPRANAQDKGRIRRLAEAVRQDDWKLVRFAPGRDRTAPDAQWSAELYRLSTDLGEAQDLAASNPRKVAELVSVARSAWVDDYRRKPFGVRIVSFPEGRFTGEEFTLEAVLGNGSSRVWTDARLTLIAPDGWQVHALTQSRAPRLPAGASLATRWRLTPPAPAPADAWQLRAVGTARTTGKASLRYETTRTLGKPRTTGRV
ncbi:sulfatase-like hydrolase/transferase [Streptomyces himalayensis]|uniref:Sulfatase-like hydrolase/transferase n=1 Tax=Streptomyces himalayensis subsp. himalayensis TaxID=2756131 RepID=A0A7W0DNB9_9ACTN|nr:sulfatase-like hydrolase/transferase [Streptomyces himalayensis]MBA2948236.1 sulfatase-like hydrolase/transferase [Streptomyces himalayensis subsp. himalayensis]